MPARVGSLVVALTVVAIGCAGAPPDPRPRHSDHRIDRASVVRAAHAMIGKPYRHGGATPRGFDCSGLVVYSYEAAGVRGLPHSADALARMAARVDDDELVPGDLLFFRLGRSKPSHVGIYTGDGEFVHAPSSGKRVERVSLDHVYWGRQPRFAGRLGR
jgi:cell wall-associated NlpC family hydrolase